MQASLFLLAWMTAAGAAVQSPQMPTNLRCEGQCAPLGIGTATPRLGWELCDQRRGARQTAYRVLVARERGDLREDGPLVWDSGQVASDESQWIAYQGPALGSRQRLWWTVRIWDQEGQPSPWAEPAWLESGILKMTDWQAKWIADSKPTAVQDQVVKAWTTYAPETVADYEKTQQLLWEHFPAPPYFRHEFAIAGKVIQARLYISARGYVVPYVNGQRVGDRVMDPAFLPYDHHAHYVVHDVTTLVREGQNAVGVLLGSGWHGLGGDRNLESHLTKRKREETLVAELHVQTDQGEVVVASDSTWKVSAGPLRKAVFFTGECYDAQAEANGWNAPGFDDHTWRAAAEVRPGSPRLLPMLSPPERVVRRVQPVKKTSPYPGVWIFDFGQHFSGRTRLTLKNLPAGTVLIQRYAQWLEAPKSSDAYYPWEDIKQRATGDLPNPSNGGHAGPRTEAAQVYCAAGRPLESWAPEFDYQTLRFVELIGYPGEPPLDVMEGEIVHTDFPRVGQVETSDARLNRARQFLIDTLLYTTHGVLQDNNCQEREQGPNIILNFLAPFYFSENDAYAYQLKLMDGLRVNSFHGIAGMMVHDMVRGGKMENRKPIDAGSNSANVCQPWYTWLFYGDRKVLEDHYATAQAFVDSFEKPMLNGEILGWGDWSDVNFNNADGKRPLTPYSSAGAGVMMEQMRQGIVTTSSFDSWPPFPLNTSIALSEMQYFTNAVQKMAQIASVLGKREDETRYRELATKLKKQIFDRFYDRQHKTFGSQAGNAYALLNELYPEEDRDAIAAALEQDFSGAHKGHVSTGWLVAYVPSALSWGGYHDAAMKVFTADDYPSFGQFIYQFGLNTMSARWPMSPDLPNTARMIQGEKNGAGRWFYDGLAGIAPDPAAPGFKGVMLRPGIPTALEWCHASYRSLYGTIESRWTQADQSLTWEIRIPPNTNGTVCVPLPSGAQTIREGQQTVWDAGKPGHLTAGLKFLRAETGYVVFAAGAGKYVFVVK